MTDVLHRFAKLAAIACGALATTAAFLLVAPETTWLEALTVYTISFIITMVVAE